MKRMQSTEARMSFRLATLSTPSSRSWEKKLLYTHHFKSDPVSDPEPKLVRILILQDFSGSGPTSTKSPGFFKSLLLGSATYARFLSYSYCRFKS
jgi:hypothetical protein